MVSFVVRSSLASCSGAAGAMLSTNALSCMHRTLFCTLPGKAHTWSFSCAYRRERFPLISLKSGSCAVFRDDNTHLQETGRLKAELFEAIDAAEGSLDDNCLTIISSLEQLKLVPDITAHPDVIKGCLVAAKANFKENRKDKQERHLGYLGARSSLGSLTFNVFKPVDLQIALYNMYQHVAIENADSYSLITEFCIVDPSVEACPLQGLIVNRGRYSVHGSNRLLVEFLSCEMRPRFPPEKVELTTWFKILKESNPGMDESGCAIVPFQMPFKGWSDIIYMDDEIRIQRGNKGGVSVLKLLEEAVVSI